MSNHQQQRPETSSENEKGEVHCYHVPLCTKWVHRRTCNRHWQKRLHEGVLDLQLTHGVFSLSDTDASDADDEGTSSSSEGAVIAEGSHSSSEDTAAELSNEIFSSSSEESDGGLPRSQQPHTGLPTPPLYFPTSPAPDEAVSDCGFNMEGNDQQSDNIYGWYTIEEKVRSSLFNVSDQVANVTSINRLPSPQRKPSLSRPIH